MRLSRFVGAGAFALLAPGTTARTAPAPGTPAHRGDTKAEPAVEAKKFIIEVEKVTEQQIMSVILFYSSQPQLTNLKSQGANLEALVSQVSKAGARVVKTFKTDVFIGLSIESEESNVDSLQELSSIAKAWPVGKIHLAPAVPSAVFSDDATASNYSVHAYTGVEQLHAQGIFGKGVVVAVVDTGVDYNHPALGGGYGPGFKVAGGYDLVGDAGEFLCWAFRVPMNPALLIKNQIGRSPPRHRMTIPLIFKAMVPMFRESSPARRSGTPA